MPIVKCYNLDHFVYFQSYIQDFSSPEYPTVSTFSNLKPLASVEIIRAQRLTASWLLRLSDQRWL